MSLRPPGQYCAIPARRPTASACSTTRSLPRRPPHLDAPANGSNGRWPSLNAHEGDADERTSLLKAAAEAVYAYFIQRELCGMRRHQDVIREYRIPNAVLVRLGAK